MYYGNSCFPQVIKKQPKTHSGKIVRHILRQAASNFEPTLGDVSYKETLYDSELKDIATEKYLLELGVSPGYYVIY